MDLLICPINTQEMEKGREWLFIICMSMNFSLFHGKNAIDNILLYGKCDPFPYSEY